jgi:cation/acetate symporter
MVATFLGTMGLPHVVVRFYTNPDGRAARQTTVAVLALLGVFYVLPPVYAALGRLYAPDLVGSGRTDGVVLALPGRMVGDLGGDLLTALLTAGAFAAFLATSSGLTIAVAGVITQDVMSKRLEGVTAFRVSAVVAVVVPFLLALVTRDVAVATVVGLAFAMAAATFCPLLLLGIWWRGLTDVGAFAGLVVGGLLTGGAVLDNLLNDRSEGWLASLVAQPAAWAVPLSFATMVVVSRVTRHRLPLHVSRFMVRLHTPEAVQLDRS